jgi:UDP-N-acetyl-D-glucosamine dehydrogenase
MTANAPALPDPARFADRSTRVGVVGLGYVGLPLAALFARVGFPVLGYDTDPDKVRALAAGRSYIRHLDGEEIAGLVSGGRFEPTADLGRLGEPDAILICVPTPLSPQREPDLRFVEETARQVTRSLRPGQLVVLESTTWPGTTEEVVRPILEGSGLASEEDFFLAYSPEREDPGNPTHTTARTPKVVGAVGPRSLAAATALYGEVIPRVVPVSTPAAAEAAKLTENVFRAVNIALANELKVVFDRMGIDVWEVLDAAATKPFGFMRFDPGPGWGGHCIPVDPFYLSWKAREHGLTARFIELAGEVNVRMPEHVVGKLVRALNERGKPVKGSRVLILGLAYKKNVDDPRESPAFEVLDQLLGLGAEVSYHDPFIPRAPAMRTWPDLPTLESVALDEAALAGADAVVLVTDHDGVDYDLVARAAPLVVDTRGVFREPLPNVVKA